MSTKLLILKHTVPIYHVIPWSKRTFLFGFNMLVKNYYKCTYFNLIHLVNSLLMIFKIWYFTNMKFISLVCVGSILTNEVNSNWRIAQFFFFTDYNLSFENEVSVKIQTDQHRIIFYLFDVRFDWKKRYN